ncbi:MAG: 50S ribosomal protein L29 [Patescibacteria group bacterium]|nr:50S ribosomal protein L29 [Patescibacteria group bacterium]MDE1944105.1 50S ribosomal protein L29 [Patescibacteria group bacterium]MDE1945038.1 50S ribosomal protein L29 [Patescibacteria group bacterium]MDE2057498.1 50S ribosomal protein L29 [Patescibacteria group bacterium]
MKDKTEAELATLLADTRKALREERFAAAGARAKDPSKARALRKTIARALTERRLRVA